MKRIRLYVDKDQEQEWLNEMAKKGWAFENFFLSCYTFVPCEPGEYTYQIDLLENWSGDKKDFATFMEDIDIEVVSQWYRWVFLRKKSSTGSFELYTDRESKIEQYRREKKFFKIGFFIEITMFFVEVTGYIRTQEISFIFLSLLLGFLALVFLRMTLKCKWKIQNLLDMETV